MKTRRSIAAISVMLAVCAGIMFERVAAAPSDTSVTPGEFVVEHPTLINLGFEWQIDGDANRNASVDVSFRKVGETAWRKGLPLARIQNERTYWANVFDLVAPNMFAGSILDLEPGAAYDASRFAIPPSRSGRAPSSLRARRG